MSSSALNVILLKFLNLRLILFTLSFFICYLLLWAWTAPSNKISSLILICQKRPGKCWTFQISVLYFFQWQDLKVQGAMIYLLVFLILFLVYQMQENITKSIKKQQVSKLLLHSAFSFFFHHNIILLMFSVFGTKVLPWHKKALCFSNQRLWDIFIYLLAYLFLHCTNRCKNIDLCAYV